MKTLNKKFKKKHTSKKVYLGQTEASNNNLKAYVFYCGLCDDTKPHKHQNGVGGINI